MCVIYIYNFTYIYIHICITIDMDMFNHMLTYMYSNYLDMSVYMYIC